MPAFSALGMTKRTGLFVLGALALLLAAGIAFTGNMMMNPGMARHAQGMMMNPSMARHRQGMMFGLPEPYRNMRNPLPATNEVLNQGAQLYQTYCAACHGKQGYGDGPAGKQLSPPPANLSHFMRMRMMARDNYLIWAISEGGKQFNTAMPGFSETLSEQDRWKIVHFLRTL
jgi:mono/diheme cytochrome c family protein